MKLTAPGFTLEVDGAHGWFEDEVLGDENGGELWFDPMTKALVDFDGVFALPEPVVTALRDAGYVVAEDYAL